MVIKNGNLFTENAEFVKQDIDEISPKTLVKLLIKVSPKALLKLGKLF